jgi:hypothetical protein
MSIVFIHSHNGPVPKALAGLAGRGEIEVVRDMSFSDQTIAAARGIITTMHLDQVGFAMRREALAAFFRRGGRLFFSGHVLKPFVDGLEVYRPSLSRKLADFQLCRLNPHPVFGDLDPAAMVTRKGVAGFYGRGHNPLPKGARALTGLGTLKQPIDWEWALPGGGLMFSHAGNDLWSQAPEESDGAEAFAARIVGWTAGALKGAAA